MKKKILLVGNTNGLPGVKVDLKNYRSYFKSNTGGRWDDTGIIEKLNPGREELIALVDNLKTQNLDYVIVIFSGHGGMKRETVLELNSDGELFNESRFENISKRQVTILDCCRVYLQTVSESIQERKFTKALIAEAGIRERFEKRILESVSQQIKLYSCAVGECSHDTSKGGTYSKNLIEAAYDDGSESIYFGNAHVKAAEKTEEEFQDQHPEIIIPRLLTSQQLIFGINL